VVWEKGGFGKGGFTKKKCWKKAFLETGGLGKRWFWKKVVLKKSGLGNSWFWEKELVATSDALVRIDLFQIRRPEAVLLQHLPAQSDDLISQKVFTKLCCKNQLPSKSVTLSFIITHKEKLLMNLHGN
jgi:23S rRNA A1618 N6-methylase RlmF